MIERRGFISDSEVREVSRRPVLEERHTILLDVTWSRYSDRQKFRPQGLFEVKREAWES
jgi:hypothetical protein